MQTNLIKIYQENPDGPIAESILRSCVHCGFCNATCPSYQVLGNELDGPRGRIYLIKQLLEGQEVSAKTRLHLDRCLSCQSCESTCPSGVDYHRLLNIGRDLVDQKLERPLADKFKRMALAKILTHPRFFALLLRIGRLLRPAMPRVIKAKIPVLHNAAFHFSANTISALNTVFLHEGCVQDAIAPEINRATKLVFENLGYRVVSLSSGCCAAIEFHLDEQDRAKTRMRSNIDCWLKELKAHPEAQIISNASGCGAFLKDYAKVLEHDVDYLEKAQHLAARIRDPVELMDAECLREALAGSSLVRKQSRVVFQSPCSLQHGQKLSGVVEALLQQVGVNLHGLRDAHLCCGSAGTFSLLQPEISNDLKQRKLDRIAEQRPDYVISANIGCQTHLGSGGAYPVQHWLVLVAEMLTEARSE